VPSGFGHVLAMNESEYPGDDLTSEDRNFAVIAHLLGIVTMFVGALIIWLIKKDDSPFVDDQAKEAINFQITIFIAQAVAGLLMAIGIGCVMMPVVLVANIVLCIVAALAASQGRWYRYPMTLRLIT
jgi:uncharacterized Tic20 family protein